MKLKDINRNSRKRNIEDLQNKISDCKKELIEILDEWHRLKNEVEPRLIFTYDSLFGELEGELQNKSKNLDEIDRRVELLSVRIKRGEKLTEQSIKFINTIVSSEIKRKYESNITNSIDKPDCPVNIKYEIPRIYRDLVKKLHPDKNGESDSYKKFWNNIQYTYKNNDYDRLRIFHHILCYDEDMAIKKEEDALRTEIRQLEFNINSERKKIRNLKNEEPFIFENLLEDHVWVAKRQRMLREKITNLDRKITYKQRLLNSMTGRVVRTSNSPKPRELSYS